MKTTARTQRQRDTYKEKESEKQKEAERKKEGRVDDFCGWQIQKKQLFGRKMVLQIKCRAHL